MAVKLRLPYGGRELQEHPYDEEQGMYHYSVPNGDRLHIYTKKPLNIKRTDEGEIEDPVSLSPEEYVIFLNSGDVSRIYGVDTIKGLMSHGDLVDPLSRANWNYSELKNAVDAHPANASSITLRDTTAAAPVSMFNYQINP